MSSIETRFKAAVRDVPDFPSPGILFKDITPVLKDQVLCRDITEALRIQVSSIPVDAIAGIESRGFLFGMMLASAMQVPFVPIRKKGKLPFHTRSQSYNLEYGSAEIEMHTDALEPGQRVLIHDDLLATGGTAAAASLLVQQLGAKVTGYSFLIELAFLKGRNNLMVNNQDIFSLVSYL